MADPHAELTLAWREWQAAALYKTWAKQNKGENAKLVAYRNGTGPRPQLATATGRALVAESAAWLQTKGLLLSGDIAFKTKAN